MTNGYDAWKLSNPWDDGHYTEGEEEKSPLDEPHFYKYQTGKMVGLAGWWVYGMILTTGQQVEVWKCRTIPTIQTDWYELDDLLGVIKRIETTNNNYDCIEQEEFICEYKEAYHTLTKIIRSEANF